MATIYVSTTGNNANSGASPAAAKATIAGGLAAASAGDTVSIADGTYTGNFPTSKGGSSGAPITIRSTNRLGATIVGEVLIQHQYIVLQDVAITGGSAVMFACDITANNVTVKGCNIFNVAKGSVTNNGGSAIEIYSADGNYTSMSNILIEGNVISDVGTGPGDNQVVQGIYVSTPVTNGRVINNLVYDVTDFGLHAFHNPSGWQYINNTVVGCGRGILTGPDFATRNNIVFNVQGRHYDVRGSGNALANNLYGGTGTGSTTSTGMLLANVDPQFVNTVGNDYRLKSTSPAINAGLNAGAPATDLLGVTRPQGVTVDLGAYEYVAPVTPPPSTPGFPYNGFLDGQAYPSIGAGSTVVNVANSSALTTALTNAAPGQRIVLANGTYSGAFTLSSKVGTATSPISVEAASTGGAIFASGSTFTISGSSAYITLKGLSFPYELTSGNLVQFRGTANRCRVTRCLFGPSSVGTPGANKTPFVYMGDDVQYIRIDHNEFRNKANPGNTILGDGNFTSFQAVRHIRIDHNYIHDIRPEVTNEKEPIRLGVSTMSKTNSYSVIERNVFVGCICEPEVISVKCGGVRVTGNTILRSIGGPVYRHGVNGVMNDNYVVDRVQTFGTTIGSGGIRFYDAGHEVSYNYIDGVYGGNFQNALMLDSGDAEGSSTNLSAHWRVVNAMVERNVLVGNPTGIVFGHNYSLAPTGCTVRDNLVASAGSGTAVTQKIAPTNTTQAGNLYGSTPAAISLTQTSDTIWRRSGYGPRLTYLQAADVGIAGDVNDSDGTGTLVGSSGGGGGSTPTDQTTAAGRFAWGQPLSASDEFDYAGSPNSSKWGLYNGVGHDNNGRRLPARVTVDGSTLVGTGLSNGDSFGMNHRFYQQYGRWEVRMRAYQNAASNGNDYHPVLIIWPESDNWPEDGEYDFVELSVPGQQTLGAFIHFPHDASAPVQQREFNKPGVDTGQFHNYAIEWTPDHIKGFVDGEEWFSTSGGASSIRKNIQDMPSGGLTIQLDNFDGTSQTPATMEVQWARVYTLTPTGGTATAQTVTATGITSREALGVPTVSVPAGPTTPPPANSTPTQLGQNLVLGSGTLTWTLSGTGPTPSGPQILTQVGRIGSGQAFGVPVLTVPDGEKFVTAVGIGSGAAFGRPTVTGGRAPDPAPGGVLVPQLFAVATDGHTLTPLPRWVKMHLSPVRNSAGSLSIDYPYGAPGFDLLASSVSANPLRALEIRVWIGGNNTAALGGWLVQKSGDDTQQGSIWTFSGHFHEWLLSKAIVAPQEISEANKSGALTFAGATAGLILATVMDQAQARGALPLVVRDFTTTHDSNGDPWAKAISSVKFSPKTTIAQIADKLVELAMCEFELTPARMFRAFNPEGGGEDRSTGPNPLSFDPTLNLKERAHRESARDAGTAVLVAGREGFYRFVSSPTAQAQLGWRAEVGVDAGQLNSQSAVDAVAPTYLETARAGVAEYSAGVTFASGRLPLIDYKVGDWGLVRTGTRYERQRIAQIELDFAPGEAPQGSVEFNDLIIDKVTALYRRLNAISTGDAVVGTSEPTPGGAGEDRIPPAAPRGLTVSSSFAYQIPGESLTLAEVRAGWEPVTTNAYLDAETADKATAAGLIADRLEAGQTTFEDWTWSGMPAVVGTYNDVLLDEAQATGLSGDGWMFSEVAREWLDNYAVTHQGGGAITDDVAHYVVQYQYLGFAGTALDGFWQSPDNSPTTQNLLVFGNIEGGRALGVRVAAVDRSGNQGPWSDVVAVDTAADDVPPPAPSKPIAVAWFRTMDITWDGRGSSGEDMLAAAPDFLSGGGLEVHVDTGIDFTPDRPIGANGLIDLAASRTYRGSLYAAGTTNITGLSIGITYYARFVAVDRSGNASEPSETSDGVLPQQLVNIDIGPDAVGRLQIIDGEIVRAKIADLAVNDAKIEEINVGKLRAGTMTANVIMGGRFETPLINGNKVEFDNAGIRLYQNNTVVGRWQVADASMLVTGTYLSALSGERINILPDGTIRLYPAAGINYAQIANNEGAGTGPRVNFRGVLGNDGRTGHINLQPTGAGLFHGAPNALGPNDPSMLASVSVESGTAGYRAALHAFEIEERMPVDPNGHRVYWRVRNSSGVPRSGTVVHYGYRSVDDTPRFWAPVQNAGICFAQGEVFAVDGSGMNFRPFRGSAFNIGSARSLKYDERPAMLVGRDGEERNLLEVARHPNSRSRRWRYRAPRRPDRPEDLPPADQADAAPAEWEFTERTAPDHIGPVADDLLLVAPDLVQVNPDDPADMTINVADLAGAAWEAVGVAGDELAALVQRVTDLERRTHSMSDDNGREAQ